jgi:guanylate kinase
MESISFNGYSYGVSVDEMAKATQDGKIAVLIVEPKGLQQIKKYCMNHKVHLFTVYIGGEPENLISRYLKRLSGEDLSSEGVAERHAKRLVSLFNEVEEWAPSFRLDGSGDYDMELESFSPGNQEQVIQLIKEIDFK